MFTRYTATAFAAVAFFSNAPAFAATPAGMQRFAASRDAMLLRNGKAIPVSGIYSHAGFDLAEAVRQRKDVPSAVTSVTIVNRSVAGPFPANEPALAVDPTDGAHLIASANDYRFGDSEGGLYSAVAGPASFTDTVQQYVDSRPYYYNSAGDPAVGIDRLGIDYFSVLAFDRSSPGRSAVVVGRSLPAAMGLFVAKYPEPVDAQAATSSTFDDKDSLAVDNVIGSAYAGSVYSAFTQFGTADSPIVSAYSRNQATSFSKLALVSLPGTTTLCPYDKGACGDDQGSSFGIGPKGVVYIAYENFDTVTAQNQIFITSSSDGGARFRPPAKVADDFDISNPFNTFRVNSFPNVAVNSKTGQIYVAWADARTGSPEIDVTTSTNGPRGPWSKPITVSSALLGGFRYFPAITVSPVTGDVYVSYYDNIDHPGVDAYDYRYRRFSASLRPQILPSRLSTVTITPDINFSGSFFGDYTSAAPRYAGAQSVWTGTSSGKQDIETAAMR